MKTDADAPRSVATVWSGVDIYAAKPPASGSRLLFGADNLFRKLLILIILSLVHKVDNPLYHIMTSTVPLELSVSTRIPDYRYKHYNEYRSEGAHNHM